MKIEIYVWAPDSFGIDIFKIKYSNNPNETWKHGLGFCIWNHSVILYWGKKELAYAS